MTLDWPLSHRPNRLLVLCLQLHSFRAGGDYGPNPPLSTFGHAAPRRGRPDFRYNCKLCDERHRTPRGRAEFVFIWQCRCGRCLRPAPVVLALCGWRQAGASAGATNVMPTLSATVNTDGISGSLGSGRSVWPSGRGCPISVKNLSCMCPGALMIRRRAGLSPTASNA